MRLRPHNFSLSTPPPPTHPTSAPRRGAPAGGGGLGTHATIPALKRPASTPQLSLLAPRHDADAFFERGVQRRYEGGEFGVRCLAAGAAPHGGPPAVRRSSTGRHT